MNSLPDEVLLMSSDQGQGSDPKQPNPGRQNDPSGAGGPQPNRPRRPLMTWVILFSLVALVWVVAVGSNDTTTQVDLNEFKTLVENKDVELLVPPFRMKLCCTSFWFGPNQLR